jgi:TrpR-related protein YerC/YecD
VRFKGGFDEHDEMRIRPIEEFEKLYEAFLELKNVDEVKRFLKDLCTPNELREFASRWRVARLLDDKTMPQKDISKTAEVSPATVTRVGNSLRDGAKGYRLVLDRLKDRL